VTKDELLAALLVERYDQTWWKSKPAETPAPRKRTRKPKPEPVAPVLDVAHDADPAALTGGRWVNRRGVQVWVESEAS
jgi:hypothetical protein